MLYEVEVTCRIYVSAEFADKAAVEKLVVTRVASEEWLLQVREGVEWGVGKYLLKGLSAAVGPVEPFRMDGTVAVRPVGEEKVQDEEEES
jgi:hypothetical protein